MPRVAGSCSVSGLRRKKNGVSSKALSITDNIEYIYIINTPVLRRSLAPRMDLIKRIFFFCSLLESLKKPTTLLYNATLL